jgi:hypothetical protein
LEVEKNPGGVSVGSLRFDEREKSDGYFDGSNWSQLAIFSLAVWFVKDCIICSFISRSAFGLVFTLLFLGYYEME